MPLRLQTFHNRDLLLGQDLRFDVFDADLPGDGLSRGTAIAGDHDDPQPGRAKQRQCLRRRRLDRIGNTQKTGWPPSTATNMTV